jgi:hypothetical protein
METARRNWIGGLLDTEADFGEGHVASSGLSTSE